MNTPKKSTSIVEEIAAWTKHLAENGRSERTVRTYHDALKNLRRFLANRYSITSTAEILPTHLEAWQDELFNLGCTPACIDLYVRAVQYWFDWQVKEDRRFVSPASGLARPPLRRTLQRCPSIQDLRRLLRSISGKTVIDLRDRALIEVAYATGARCEEIVRLDETAVDLDRRVVRLFGKGSKERVVPLTIPACRALADYLQKSRPKLQSGTTESSALFLGTRGARRLEGPAVASIIRGRGAAIGLRLSPHDLRRAFATHLLLGGAGVAPLKEMLGHVDFSHLKSYLQLSPTAMLAAVKNSPLGQ